MVHDRLAVYKPLLYFSVYTMSFLTACRVLLVIWQWPRVVAVEGVGTVLLQDLRFDFILICSLILLPALLAPILGHKNFWSVIQKVYLIIAFVLLAFMEAATPTFISEYDLRPNILFVEYLKYPKEVGLMLIGGYKLDIFFGLLFVAAFTLHFTKKLNPFSIVNSKRMFDILASILD